MGLWMWQVFWCLRCRRHSGPPPCLAGPSTHTGTHPKEDAPTARPRVGVVGGGRHRHFLLPNGLPRGAPWYPSLSLAGCVCRFCAWRSPRAPLHFLGTFLIRIQGHDFFSPGELISCLSFGDSCPDGPSPCLLASSRRFSFKCTKPLWHFQDLWMRKGGRYMCSDG